MLTRTHLKLGAFGFAILLFIAASFRWLDLPIAHVFANNPSLAHRYGVSSIIILSGEFLVAAMLVTMRLARGYLLATGKALLLANMASICAFAANDYVLKRIFGVPNPLEVLARELPHTFHLFQGSDMSSFPSGHMAMASAFAGVWIRLYPRTTLFFSGLISLGMTILVIGEWHFISDVFAGTFLGTTVGLATGELWLQHSGRIAGNRHNA